MKKYLSLFIIIAIMLGCEKYNEKSGQPPTANAGIDQEAIVGNTVSLNGTGTDADGDELTFSWDITSAPSGSNAVLSNPTSQNPSFIPDVAGSYTIILSVSDGVHENVTDDVVINATEASVETMIIDSDINENTTLEDIFESPDKADYLVTSDVDVNAELTVKPGVVIHFQRDKLLNITELGMISAEGSIEYPVVLTSANIPGEVRWAGILIESSDVRNSLKNVVIDWAGSEANIYSGGWKAAALSVGDESKIKLNNTTISNSGGYGLFVNKSGELSEFSNNSFKYNEGNPVGLHAMQVSSIDGNSTFSENRKDVVEINKSTLESNDDEQWNALNNARYYLPGDLTINTLLRIEEGAQFELEKDAEIVVDLDGALIAKGSATDWILFTTANEIGQVHWSGIIFKSPDVRNELDYVHVSWAASTGNFYYGGWQDVSIGIEDNAKLSITNSKISSSKADGLYVHPGAKVSMADLSFEDNQGLPVILSANQAVEVNEGFQFENNSENVIAVYSSEFTNTEKDTWVSLSNDAFYLVMDEIEITESLNINAGASLKFTDGASLMVKESGALKAVGTESNMITFTAHLTNSKWDGISIETNHVDNKLNYCEISYGGKEALLYRAGYRKANVAVHGTLEIQNSVIANSDGTGFFISNSSLINGMNSTDEDLESTLLSENSFSNNADSAITIE